MFTMRDEDTTLLDPGRYYMAVWSFDDGVQSSPPELFDLDTSDWTTATAALGSHCTEHDMHGVLYRALDGGEQERVAVATPYGWRVV